MNSTLISNGQSRRAKWEKELKRGAMPWHVRVTYGHLRARITPSRMRIQVAALLHFDVVPRLILIAMRSVAYEAPRRSISPMGAAALEAFFAPLLFERGESC